MFICACSDVGKIRDINQDAYYYVEDPTLPIFIVADGMGGHKAGEVASNLAISTVIRHYEKCREKLIKKEMFIPQFLNEAVEYANDNLIEESKSDNELKGMGTTVTMCLILDGEMYVGHVGDSRAYLLRDKELTQITQDHSLVGELLRIGSITKDEAVNHPKKNIITRALGSDPKIKVDVFNRELKRGDKIILCTDGLTNMVTEGKILDILLSDENPSAICSTLVNISNEAGGIDNTTIMIIKANEE